MVSLEGYPVFPIPAIIVPPLIMIWKAYTTGRGTIPCLLADELTLSQLGGTLCPQYYYVPPPLRFSDLSVALNMYLHLVFFPALLDKSQCLAA